MAKNIILIVFFLFSLIANAHTLDEIKGDVPTKAEIDDAITKIKSDKKLSPDEMNKGVLETLWLASSFMNYEDTVSLILKYEDSFFTKPSKLRDVIDYYNFSIYTLLPILSHNKKVGYDNWDWPFRHTYEEFLQQTIDLTNVKQCDSNRDCIKFSDDPFLKILIVNPALSNKYQYNSDWVNFEKINSEQIRLLEQNKQFKTSLILDEAITPKGVKPFKAKWPGYRKFILYNAHIDRFKILSNSDSFADVVKEGEYLDRNFEENLNWLAQDGNDNLNGINGVLTASFAADNYLGKYDEVIRKGNLILEKLAKNSKFNFTRDMRAIVLKEVAQAYWHTNQRDLRAKYLLEALDIELETGTINGKDVANLILDSIYQHDLITARKYNDLLDKECTKKLDDLRCKGMDTLLNKLTGLDPDVPKKGIVGIALEEKEGNKIITTVLTNKPAEQAGIKVGDTLLEINGVNVKNYSVFETYDHIRGIPNEKISLLILRNDNDKPIKYELVRAGEIDDLQIIQNYWLRIAFDHERTINPNYDIKDGNFSDDQEALKLYDEAFGSFIAGGNEHFAAIYAKKFINVLQKLRSQLASSKSNSLNQFTNNHADKIKAIANVFYNVGQYDAAWACQRIIQENEFLDYVRRRGVDKDFLSTIPTNSVENDYLIKLTNNFKENNDLNQKLTELKGKEKTSEYKLISSAFENSKKDLELLRKNYSQSLKDESRKNLNASNQPIQQLNLKSHEAAIQFILNNNQLTTFVSTTNQNERFVQAVNANQLRENIQKLNISVATQKPISDDLVAYVSDLFMKDPLKLISGKEIRALRISMDSTLNSLPLSLLKIDGKSLDETYSLEKTGIGKVTASKQTNKKYVVAYAATKGNSEFLSLPGASKEIDKIMRIKSSEQYSNKQSFVDERFNLQSFTAGLSNDNYFVHIATHFRINGNTAHATKMLLGDGSTLSLEELRDALPNISADLVTLSACNTGQQFISSKTQAYDGLSSTFQVKGVRNVLSTLWEISDDATADFMTIFYSLLLNNKITPPEALAYTQTIFSHGSIHALHKNILLIKDNETSSAIDHLSKYTNPYYWAAFQISTIN